jgi:transposase
MHEGRFVFAQLMEFLPKHEFDQCVKRYHGNRRLRSFSCYDQFLCMAFAQLAYRESLRDTVACLRKQQSKLFHAGIRGTVSRSTLADANESRDWRIYADFAQALIAQARRLYADEKFDVELANSVYALDSTSIDLCLSVFPWARFKETKGAIKLHTLLNLRGNIPEFIHISDGKMHDRQLLEILIPERGSIYIVDRGYQKFERYYALHLAGATFITRAKSDIKMTRIYSHPIDKATGLCSDQSVILTSRTRKDYPDAFRRIVYRAPDSDTRFVFITNNFALPALTIAELYKARWQIELFFRWIKQHLRIKSFYGTSANAVKTQIWIAVSVYVLVAIIKKRLGLTQSLYEILQFLSIGLFEKTPNLQGFFDEELQKPTTPDPNQLELLDL